MSKIRDFLKGKKTYITAATAILAAVGLWVDGSIDLLGLAAAAFGAIQTVFIRAGIDNSLAKKE